MQRLIFSFILLATLSITTLSSHPTDYFYQEAQEKFVSVPKAELYCRMMGKGDPIIVIHGGAGYMTHDGLLPHMACLAAHNLVIFYDQRTLGLSTGEPTLEQINLKTYVEDIEAIRQSLGVDKVTILGHSFGSLLGMQYALSYPEAVDKLILLNSMPGSLDDVTLFLTEIGKRFAPIQQEIHGIENSNAYLAGDPEAHEKYLRKVFQTYMYNPNLINQLNLHKSQKTNLNGLKVWEIFKESCFMKPYSFFSDLQNLRCQTLLIHGDTDPIPFETAEHLHQAIPQSKLVKLEKCGHFSYVEQPDMLFKTIQEFLHS